MNNIAIDDHKTALAVIANLKAQLEVVDELCGKVNDRVETGTHRILTTLGYGLERIKQLGIEEMFTIINTEVDSLQRELVIATNDYYRLKESNRLGSK